MIAFYNNELASLLLKNDILLKNRPYICNDSLKCYSSTDKVTLFIKKFAFHISTFGSMTI